MGYTPYKRACIFIPFNEVKHLFVVMNDPCKDGLCLLVMISSIKEGRTHDDTCVLNVGDHPFITHPSYIVYRMAEYTRAAHIGNMVDKGYYEASEDAGEELYSRIAKGLFVSEETKGTMIRYAKSVGL